jgi:hypothetical protein
LSYQYQIDYGAGYEVVYPQRYVRADQVAGVAAWLSSVEAEGSARRARVVSGEQIIVERVFDCVVVESRTQTGGRTRHLVHCPGGEVVVEEQAGGSLSGSARPGYVGDADQAAERAFEAVLALRREHSK